MSSISKLDTLNRTLLFMLIFTIISSYLAYRIVVKAYDNLEVLEVAQ